MPLPLFQLIQSVKQQLAVHVILDGLHDQVAFRTKNIREQQLIAIPVGIQRLVKRHFTFQIGNFTQVH